MAALIRHLYFIISAAGYILLYHMQTKNDRDFVLFLNNLKTGQQKHQRGEKRYYNKICKDAKIFVYFISNFCYNENDWEVSV